LCNVLHTQNIPGKELSGIIVNVPSQRYFMIADKNKSDTIHPKKALGQWPWV
jgi:hypothetical protein